MSLPPLIRVLQRSVLHQNRYYCASHHERFVLTLSNRLNLEALKNLVNENLFGEFYPMDIVQGIRDVSQECLKHGFNGVDIKSEAPFLVRDKLMDGFNSLIALESKWCRGYMMLQASKGNVSDYIQAKKTGVDVSDILEQDANTLISNLTNEMWGAIRREFMGYGNELENGASRTQVPIFIDPDKRYISFGTFSYYP